MVKGINYVKGLKVGHCTDEVAGTGCTVLIAERGAVAACEVRGSAPGTRETDLLRPGSRVRRVHAILLSGGSAFGLDAATGVMHYLEEEGIGFNVGVTVVPIVPAAILFDLRVGDWRRRPDASMGYAACRCASDGDIAEGNVGAGTGATVGNMYGPERATKGGLATVSFDLQGGNIGALVAVNAFGDVVSPATGAIIAGLRDPGTNEFVGTLNQMRRGWEPATPGLNTVLAVVATDLPLGKEGAQKMAQMAHNGIGRAISPAHTMYDGDTVFALSTALDDRVEVDPSLAGAIAAEMVAAAIVRAVKCAQSAYGVPSLTELATQRGKG